MVDVPLSRPPHLCWLREKWEQHRAVMSLVLLVHCTALLSSSGDPDLLLLGLTWAAGLPVVPTMTAQGVPAVCLRHGPFAACWFGFFGLVFFFPSCTILCLAAEKCVLFK